jgi:hypothetical protein
MAKRVVMLANCAGPDHVPFEEGDLVMISDERYEQLSSPTAKGGEGPSCRLATAKDEEQWARRVRRVPHKTDLRWDVDDHGRDFV